MFPSQICICFYFSLFPLMDELSISSICSLEKLTASVSLLFTGFYHPKTSYDAFLNPASSSSYYPISLFLFKTKSLSKFHYIRNLHLWSLLNPLQSDIYSYHFTSVIKVPDNFHVTKSSGPFSVLSWFNNTVQQLVTSSLRQFLQLASRTPLSFWPISPALFSNFSCQIHSLFPVCNPWGLRVVLDFSFRLDLSKLTCLPAISGYWSGSLCLLCRQRLTQNPQVPSVWVGVCTW